MLYFIKQQHIIEIQKLKYEIEQYYLKYKHKHSMSITKDMSKSVLWKEQTGWILLCVANAFSNNKRLMYFFFTFSYSCNCRESIVFESNFRNGEFDGFARYDASWIRKIAFLAFGLSLCVYLCICATVISIT